MTALDLFFTISTFRNCHDNRPNPQQVTWAQLSAMLTRHDVREEKDGPCFSPVSYLVQKRSKKNVDFVYGLTLDIDSGRPNAEAFSPYLYCAYTTYNHTLDLPKWRVFLPFEFPVLACEWEPIWRKLVHHLCPSADPACCDASRLYYFPACPPGSSPRAFIHQGILLNHASFAGIPQPEIEERELKSRQVDTGGKPGDDFDDSVDWDDVLSRLGAKRCGRYDGRDAWTRPGKDHGISFLTGNGPFGDRLMNFSSSVPLPIKKPIRKWHVVAYWDFGGDFNACAQWLKSQGFGSN